MHVIDRHHEPSKEIINTTHHGISLIIIAIYHIYIDLYL